MRGFFLFALLIQSFAASSQKPDTLFLNSDFDAQRLDYIAEYTLQDPKLSLTQILGNNTSWKTYSRKEKITERETTLWTHFFINNNEPEVRQFFIRNYRDDAVTIYLIKEDTIVKKHTGALAKPQLGNDLENIDFQIFDIQFGETIEVFLESRPHKGLLGSLNPLKQKAPSGFYVIGSDIKMNSILKGYYSHNIKEVQIRNFYQGALFLITVIALFFLIKNPEQKLYLYYFAYVFSGFMYSVIQSRGYTFIGQLVLQFPYIKKYGEEYIFWTGISSYFIFASLLLDLKDKRPKLDLTLRKASSIIFAFGSFLFLYQILTNDNNIKIFIQWNKIPVVLFYLWFLGIAVFQLKGTLTRYILAANFALLIFSILAWMKDINSDQRWPGILDFLFTLPLAVLIEVIIFSFAMSIKQRIDTNEKLEAERKVLDTEMLALRSQMNPHFVFNSLNSIRNLILKNENDKASIYLSRFSKLVRTILQQTQKKTISLEEELETLKLYVDSESDRLGKEIEFSMTIDPLVEVAEISFPPMLLQPVVENAIWHGLQTSENPSKKIEINVSHKNENQIEISVSDNGIGRKQAEKLKSSDNQSRISLGSEITKKRLELFNRDSNYSINMTIHDREEESGTLVLFTYSLKD